MDLTTHLHRRKFYQTPNINDITCYDKFKFLFSVTSRTTPLHRHQKQPISLVVTLLRLKLSQNSKTIPGDKSEHWQRGEIHMVQSHLTMKPWSLVETPTRKFTFMVRIIVDD